MSRGWRAQHNRCEDVCGTRTLERCGRGVAGGTGGHDVVDQDDVAALDALAGDKDITQVALARVTRQPTLRQRRSLPVKHSDAGWQTCPPRRNARQFPRLIEAS